MELLDIVLKAHGGLDKWNEFSEVTAHMKVGGATWKFKGQEGVLDNINYNASLNKQYGIYFPFITAGQQSIFENGRVAIENTEGDVVEELLSPRASFESHTRETQWSKLQLVYFASYAMWSYLTLPFNFTLPGFTTKEIEPWETVTEKWRRLEVTFPDNIETHSKKQVFYYGDDGLLRRHDYKVEILGGAPAAHYVFDYKDFNGIMLPTKRRVYSINKDNSYKPEPVFIAIDIISAEFK